MYDICVCIYILYTICYVLCNVYCTLGIFCTIYILLYTQYYMSCVICLSHISICVCINIYIHTHSYICIYTYHHHIFHIIYNMFWTAFLHSMLYYTYILRMWILYISIECIYTYAYIYIYAEDLLYMSIYVLKYSIE